MSTNPDTYLAKHHHGWSTPANDYCSHVSRLEKSPSVLPDFPRYPNVHMIFHNKAVYEDVQQEVAPPKAREAHKKVHFAEQEKTTQCDSNGDCRVQEESINVESDGFIQQKHTEFALCKWRTFEM